MKDDNQQKQWYILLFGSWLYVIPILHNCNQYTLTSWLHTVLLVRAANVPLDVFLKGTKWGRHSNGIRCCQPIRCLLITDGVRSGWWHIWHYVHHRILISHGGKTMLLRCVVYRMVMTSSPPLPPVLLHPKVVPQLFKLIIHPASSARGSAIIFRIIPNLQIILGRSLV